MNVWFYSSSPLNLLSEGLGLCPAAAPDELKPCFHSAIKAHITRLWPEEASAAVASGSWMLCSATLFNKGPQKKDLNVYASEAFFKNLTAVCVLNSLVVSVQTSLIALLAASAGEAFRIIMLEKVIHPLLAMLAHRSVLMSLHLSACHQQVCLLAQMSGHQSLQILQVFLLLLTDFRGRST